MFGIHFAKVTAVLCAVVVSGAAWAAEPVTEPDAQKAIDKLRNLLVESFNKNDAAGLLQQLDENVVVTWQNGEVCVGHKELTAYSERMMNGPSKVVSKVHADPKVIGRHMQGDWAVSWGTLNDHFSLTDGSELDMNTRFTATIARRGEVWKVVAIHFSVNAFDNPILGIAAKKGATYGAVGGGIAGLLIGAVVVAVVKKKGKGQTA